MSQYKLINLCEGKYCKMYETLVISNMEFC